MTNNLEQKSNTEGTRGGKSQTTSLPTYIHTTPVWPPGFHLKPSPTY